MNEQIIVIIIVMAKVSPSYWYFPSKMCKINDKSKDLNTNKFTSVKTLI